MLGDVIKRALPRPDATLLQKAISTGMAAY